YATLEHLLLALIDDLDAAAVLRACSVDILAASVDEGSCGVYWQERGDTANVEVIRTILLAWAEQIP
ncbi:MAG: Clp protease N-terminal domain-containing protein, partial [Haliea sp.]